MGEPLQIEDYEPRHSIVITPAKMVRYYETVKLKNELYPWSSAFPLCRKMYYTADIMPSCFRHALVSFPNV